MELPTYLTVELPLYYKCFGPTRPPFSGVRPKIFQTRTESWNSLKLCSGNLCLFCCKIRSYLHFLFPPKGHNLWMDRNSCRDEESTANCTHTTLYSWNSYVHEHPQTLSIGRIHLYWVPPEYPSFPGTLSSNHGSPLHPSENYKLLASEWRHSGWTSYGTMTGGSCSIRVHLG